MPGDGRCRQATRECPKVRRDVRTLANAPCCLALLETPVRGEIPQEPAPIKEGVPYARGRKRAMRARWSGSRDGGRVEEMQLQISRSIPEGAAKKTWNLRPVRGPGCLASRPINALCRGSCRRLGGGPVARGMEGCFGKCRFVQRQSCRSKKKKLRQRGTDAGQYHRRFLQDLRFELRYLIYSPQ